jgi:hypothetical protein
MAQIPTSLDTGVLMDLRYLIAPVWGLAVVMGFFGPLLEPGRLQDWNPIALIAQVAITVVAAVGLGACVLRPGSAAGEPSFAIATVALVSVGDFLRRGETRFGILFSVAAVVAIASGTYAVVSRRRRGDRLR